MKYLRDTNHIGEAIGRVSIVRDRIQQMHRQGAVFGTCGPVLCDAVKARKRLDTLLQVVRVWPIDLLIAEQYARVYHEMQKAGRALSQVDMILGAMTRQLDAHLLTTDNDFKALADVRTETWLEEGA